MEFLSFSALLFLSSWLNDLWLPFWIDWFTVFKLSNQFITSLFFFVHHMLLLSDDIDLTYRLQLPSHDVPAELGRTSACPLSFSVAFSWCTCLVVSNRRLFNVTICHNFPSWWFTYYFCKSPSFHRTSIHSKPPSLQITGITRSATPTIQNNSCMYLKLTLV